MKDFFKILQRFLPPYKRNMISAVLLNLLSAILNVFSFTLIIPILSVLFGVLEPVHEFIPWDSGESFKDLILHNGQYYITYIIEEYGSSLALMLLGLSLIILTFFKTAAYFFSSAAMIPIRTGVVRDLRVQLYHKIVSLPLSFFSEQRKGDVIARMSGDVNEVESSIMSSIDMLLKNPILIIVYFSTLIAISWQLTLFTIVIAPVMAWFMGFVGRKLKRRSLEAQGKWSDLMAQVEETLGGLRVIKAFNAQKNMESRFERSSNDYRNIINRVNTRQQMAHPMSEFLGTIMIVIVLWFGGTLILNSDSMISAPGFIFYLTILYSIINPIKDFSKASYNIPKGLASMERIDAILLAESTINDPESPVEMKGLNDQIEYKNVSFRYETVDVLKNINVTIKKGQSIALVGQSGSGKSTFVDLLPRFHDVQKGAISIDGVDIRDMRMNDIRSIMGYVNQEAILFNDTFYNNIAFGIENATMEEVVQAAKIANAHEFILQTEEGYDTLIGDRGGKLSGGQRQRISIARAILKNPPILILDEATSALDTESEYMVQDALEKLMKNRTTIAIAHRLSTVKNADVIFVLHEGEVVEHGKHEDLLLKGGYYKNLYDMQSF